MRLGASGSSGAAITDRSGENSIVESCRASSHEGCTVFRGVRDVPTKKIGVYCHHWVIYLIVCSLVAISASYTWWMLWDAGYADDKIGPRGDPTAIPACLAYVFTFVAYAEWSVRCYDPCARKNLTARDFSTALQQSPCVHHPPLSPSISIEISKPSASIRDQ